MSHQVLPNRGFRKAVSMGGIFAVSTVLPGKVQHLAFNLKTIDRFGIDGVLGYGLQILGCLMLLSVLIWASKSEPNPVRPLLAYPPQNRDTVLVHVAGLVTGVLLMLR